MHASLSHKTISLQAEQWLTASQLPVGISPADLLLMFTALHASDGLLARRLFEHFMQRSQPINQIITPHPFELVQTTILELIQVPIEEAVQHWPVLVRTYENLRQLLDEKDTGILQWPEDEISSFQSRSELQSFHVGAAEYLIELAQHLGEDYSSLALDLDILIFEANEQLWDEPTGLYHDDTAIKTSIASYLPLWAKIPNQDQAEELLINLRQTATPWVGDSSPEWASGMGYLIYLGLQHYDMYQAARELKSYIEKELTGNEQDWRAAAIKICFSV